MHTDSSPESDDEVASFNYELLNYEISENEQNEYTHLAASESSLEDIEDNDPEKATSELKNFLRNWAVINGVKSCAVSDLLSHLKKYVCFSTLPKDTLLCTPRKCDVIDVPPGKYCHFGLINGIMESLNNGLQREKCKLQGVYSYRY